MVNRSSSTGLGVKISNYPPVPHLICPPRKPIIGLHVPLDLRLFGPKGSVDSQRNMGKCKTPPPSFATVAHSHNFGAYVTPVPVTCHQNREGSPKVKRLNSSPSTFLAKPSPSHYAGAKFSDPPAPTALPKPPPHWVKGSVLDVPKCNIKTCGNIIGGKNCSEMTYHLKVLLNVQA